MTRFCPPWLIAWAALAAAGGASAQSAQALQAQHGQLQQALAQSPFERPLVLQANASTQQPQGDIYAVLDHPFGAVGSAFQKPAHWCDVLMLQLNVKHCEVAERGGQRKLQVAIGKKAEQPLEDAFRVDFDYQLRAAQADYLSAEIHAADGPLGTSDYQLTLEAVPVDARHSFIHMSYSYANGLSARLATRAYLATSGRDKVGFTVARQDEAGRPVYVGGMRGVAERSAMRYFLAIDAFLDAQSAPPEQRTDRRLRGWFGATERYARQLHEMDLADYLKMKRRQLQPSWLGAFYDPGG
ncbi:hypothetical protein [Ideonella sp.]|uniref:hypothetical protein n=1 Tax=Ideonella sp. TaxID=1929293 RepID=UPI0035B1207C